MVAWATSQLGRDPSLALGMTSVCALCNPNCFHVSKLANPFGTQLAAVTGSFDPAERNARTGRHHRIDEHHSALKFVRKEFLFGGIVCPNAGAKAKTGIVCDSDGFVAIPRAK